MEYNTMIPIYDGYTDGILEPTDYTPDQGNLQIDFNYTIIPAESDKGYWDEESQTYVITQRAHPAYLQSFPIYRFLKFTKEESDSYNFVQEAPERMEAVEETNNDLTESLAEIVGDNTTQETVDELVLMVAELIGAQE